MFFPFEQSVDNIENVINDNNKTITYWNAIVYKCLNILLHNHFSFVTSAEVWKKRLLHFSIFTTKCVDKHVDKKAI